MRRLPIKQARPADVRERVKSYEDACVELMIPVITNWEDMTMDEIAYIKLKTIVRALNEGWLPDWEDSDQYKYWVWFDMSDLIKCDSCGVLRSVGNSNTQCGVAAAYASCDASYTGSVFGSRLALKSSELAIYCGNTFASLWAEYMLIL